MQPPLGMELSNSAQEVLGFIVSHLGPIGGWGIKPEEGQRALKISSATLTRALGGAAGGPGC